MISPFMPLPLSSAIVRNVPARFTAEQKNQIARDLAHQIGFNYDSALQSRLLHLMNASEVKQLAETGSITFEAHTHRHRTPPEASGMQRELEDNNRRIEQLTGRKPLHFCYPSGNYRREYFRLLKGQDFVRQPPAIWESAREASIAISCQGCSTVPIFQRINMKAGSVARMQWAACSPKTPSPRVRSVAPGGSLPTDRLSLLCDGFLFRGRFCGRVLGCRFLRCRPVLG